MLNVHSQKKDAMEASYFIIVAALVALFAAFYVIIQQRLKAWKEDTERAVHFLFKSDKNERSDSLTLRNCGLNTKAVFHDRHEFSIKHSMDHLPLLIRKYLQQAIICRDTVNDAMFMNYEPCVPIIKALCFKQEGYIFANNKWLPFEATQYINTSPACPGYVWDGVISLYPNIPVLNNLVYSRARDSYVRGKGGLDQALLGFLPRANTSKWRSHNRNSILLMRWLTEIVLHPTTCLPHRNGERIHWTQEVPMEGPWPKHNGTFIRARIKDPHSSGESEVDVEFCFSANGMISSARSYRALVKEGKTIMAPWEAHFSHYAVQGKMRVPAKMEAGFYEDGRLNTYFVVQNTQFEYLLCD